MPPLLNRMDTHAALHQLVRPSVGLGCAVALYGLLVWLPSTFFQDAGVPLALAGHAPSIINGLALIALAFLPNLQKLEGHGGAALIAVLSLIGATPWIPGVSRTIAGAPLLAIGAGIAAGLAVAFLLARWLNALAPLGERPTHGVLVGAAFVSSTINIVTGLLPQGWGYGVALVCIVVELGLLARPGKTVATAQETKGPQNPLRTATRSLLPVLAAAAVLTFAAPLVNTVLMADSLVLSVRLVLSAAMNLAVAMLLAALWFIPQRPPSVFAVLLGFTGVLFAAIVLVWALGLHAASLLLGLGSAAFFLVTYLVFDASLKAARANGLGPVRTYGIVGGLVMLARVVADVVSARLHNSLIAEESKMLIALFLLIYLLTCAAFLLYGAVARNKKRPGEIFKEPAAETPAPTTSWNLLAHQCDRVSQAFDLSQRESEVLSLIMQGRNVPAVAEELVVSRNTVQTHVRHIYERLGIHSRQELVAFVKGYGANDTAEKGAPLS